MKDCIFCKIVKGEIPSYKIYEDSEFLGFLDVFPKTEGHTLVIPKTHVEWVWDYPNLGKYFEVVGKVARSYRDKTGGEMVRLMIFGMDVVHAHIHLLPGKSDNLTEKKLDDKKLKEIEKKFKLA